MCEGMLNQILFLGLKSKLSIYLMTSSLLIHAQHSINCVKLVDFYKGGGKLYKHYNSYLIPYLCSGFNHEHRIILGHFLLPMWHTLERTMLSRGGDFSHSYLTSDIFHLEYRPRELKEYNFLGTSSVSSKPILISDMFLKPQSILLFPIHRDVAKPLIEHKLL